MGMSIGGVTHFGHWVLDLHGGVGLILHAVGLILESKLCELSI